MVKCSGWIRPWRLGYCRAVLTDKPFWCREEVVCACGLAKGDGDSHLLNGRREGDLIAEPSQESSFQGVGEEDPADTSDSRGPKSIQSWL